MGALSLPRRLGVTEDRAPWRPSEPLERFLGAVLFFLTLPVLLPAAAVLCLLSRRSPFVAHRRLGRNSAELWVLKLRTMWNSPRGGFRLIEHVADQPGLSCKPKSDPRVTSRFAAFCRRYSIDELPQLLQVALGQLSLIGPRPITAAEFERYYAQTSPEILTVKPGVTGLWQVKGRSRLSYSQRRRLDAFFTRKLSRSLYLYILLRTPLCVMQGRDAW
jgi:exopolysaccharide production protein ExoY